MQTKDIDKLIKCIENESDEGIIKLANEMGISIKMSDFNDRRQEILAKIMNQIECEGKLIEHLKIKLVDTNTRDSVSLIVFLSETDNIKYFVDNREKYGFSKYDIKDFIKTTKNKDYIKSCIDNREKYGFSKYDIIDLIKTIKDKDYVKEFIKNRHKHGFNISDIIDLIRVTGDKKYYIESCVKDSKEYGLNSLEIGNMIIDTRDKVYIEKCFAEGKFGEFCSTKKLEIPKGMQFGIEIESEGSSSKHILKLSNLIADDWKCEEDRSLNNGVEVISPVLKNEQSAVRDINKVCTILKACGQAISERCGGHIHIDASYLTSIEAYKNLIELWTNSEYIIYIISNEKGDIPRSGMPKFASPISNKIENAINSGEIDLQGEGDLEELVSSLKSIQQCKHSGINFKNICKDGNNTIEFRTSNGTINTTTWVENINLFCGIVKAAEEIAIIQKKPEEERILKESEKLEAFERLRSDEIEDTDRLEDLLTLTIDDEKQVYTDRYKVNSELIKKKPSLMDETKKKIADKKINLTKNDIGRVALGGKNSISAEEYKINCEIVNSYLRKEKENNLRT